MRRCFAAGAGTNEYSEKFLNAMKRNLSSIDTVFPIRPAYCRYRMVSERIALAVEEPVVAILLAHLSARSIFVLQ